MPKNPVFDAARGHATPELVESLFASSGAYWDGPEYWTLNPTRGDSAVGSFSINGHTGLWSDFASGDKGDLIKLMVDSGKVPNPKAAAEMIVAACGGALDGTAGYGTSAPAKSHLDKPKRVPPVIPVPDDKIASLEDRVKGKWATENRGTAVKSWGWRTPEGGLWCATTRYNKPDGGKDVIAHYFGEDGKWHEGNPMAQGRHLFRADQIAKADSGTHILVVEGEKKASVKVEGYLVTTWIGGAQAVVKSDWAPLERFAALGQVTIWPDADEPGVKAASAIMKRLPGARMLVIKDKPQGWDLADAVSEGRDILEFMASCGKLGGPPDETPGTKDRPDAQAPFLCLGYDKASYHFMKKDRRVVFSIGMGGFNTSKLGELAGLGWWGLLNMTTDQGGIKTAPAQDMLVDWQQQIGFFDPKRIRGSGVWRDQDGIVLNQGERMITMDGRSLAYTAFPTNYYYVPSQVRFGEMHGAESTDEDGLQLEELFRSLEFEEVSMAILLMGWCLISPFGGVLKWRPHVWLTGQKGSGKTWAMDNIVIPLCGPFAYLGSGKDTEAGIRWALDQDARPSILAEMEPKNKTSRDKIASILELVRNASDDSGIINISQAGGGTKNFRIRSMFAFSSKVMPVEDDAVSSRITRLELARSKDEAAKIRKCVALLSNLMDDPGRFTRRIFHALPRIIADIEYLRSSYLGAFKSQRTADQMAPMLAAAWAVQSDRSIRESGRWLERWITELSHETKAVVDDEDAFMETLVGLRLKTDDNNMRTVAELLERVADFKDTEDKALHLLERHGITLRQWGTRSAPWTLSIAVKAKELSELLRDTTYGDAYGAQVKRNRFVKHSKDGRLEARQIRLKCGNIRCHDLEWEGFRAMYLGREDGGQPELETYSGDEHADRQYAEEEEPPF